jgi:DHA2 family multidrug resistance protein
MTVSQAVLFESFPLEEAGMAMALFGLGVMVGPTIGPTLGGWLTDNYGWPWIFYVNIPVGIVAAVMIAGYVDDPSFQKRPRTIDYAGIALLIVSVGALQYVLEHGQREDWFASHMITWLTVIGVVGGIGLAWRELTTDNPVVDFRVLKHRQMWVGTLLGVVMGIGLYAMSFTLPVFMQGNLQMTAEQTGWILMPGALATAVSMAVVGKMTNRFDPRLLIALGAFTFAVAAWKLSLITGLSGAQDFFWPLILRGVGLGFMFVPLTTITLAELSPTEMAQGTGLYNFFRQLGGSFGIAGISTLLIRYTAQNRANLVSHISTLNPVSMDRINAMTRGMMAKGADFWTAKAQAIALIDKQLMGEASVLAYARIYEISALLILLLIPLLLLVRKTRGIATAHAIME